MKIEVEGVITACEMRQKTAVDWNFSHRYSPNTEHYDVFLDIQLETKNGLYKFLTPRTKMNVTLAGPVAVVTFPQTSKWNETTNSYVFPNDHPWFRRVGTNAVATKNAPADVRLVPKVAVGDTIRVSGRIKNATSRLTYLNYVRRIMTETFECYCPQCEKMQVVEIEGKQKDTKGVMGYCPDCDAEMYSEDWEV